MGREPSAGSVAGIKRVIWIEIIESGIDHFFVSARFLIPHVTSSLDCRRKFRTGFWFRLKAAPSVFAPNTWRHSSLINCSEIGMACGGRGIVPPESQRRPTATTPVSQNKGTAHQAKTDPVRRQRYISYFPGQQGCTQVSNSSTYQRTFATTRHLQHSLHKVSSSPS
jgi:hypothetical protein